VQIEKCDLTRHFVGYEEYFKEAPLLEHHYCQSLNKSVNIKGAYGKIPRFSFFQILF
jgi:hypothetical protein